MEKTEELSFVLRLLTAETTLQIQLTICFINCCFWGSFFYLAKPLLMNYMRARPYIPKLIEIQNKKFKAIGQGPFEKDYCLEYWCDLQLVACQHLFSSMLVAPMVFGLNVPFDVAILARHAALMEMGWEWYDI